MGESGEAAAAVVASDVGWPKKKWRRRLSGPRGKRANRPKVR
jgi:hypothetical protein